MAVAERALPNPPGVRLVRWPRWRIVVAIRAAIQALLLMPVTRWLCRPLRVEGRRRLHRVRGPVVFAANHASHADTALILAALPPRHRARTAPAAAEDYFFGGRLRGALVALGIGAFPFPRRGAAGLARAEALLDDGWSVLLFPEGTRSLDGSMQRFRSGIGVLAARGATVVPVGVAGTDGVLPKGHRVPRQRPVAVVFGEPIRIEPGIPAGAATARIERRVSRLRAAARLLRPAPRRRVVVRARSLACSRAGAWCAFAWGAAEALYAPVVPDVFVAVLVVAAPRRALALAAAALAGSLAGGTVGYLLGGVAAGAWLLEHAPLVTEPMRAHALDAMSSGDAAPLLAQPWSGVPFKVYGYQAADAGVRFDAFALVSAAGRGLRLAASATVFAIPAWEATRRVPAIVEALYVPFLFGFAAVFSIGLSRVVAAWS